MFSWSISRWPSFASGWRTTEYRGVGPGSFRCSWSFTYKVCLSSEKEWPPWKHRKMCPHPPITTPIPASPSPHHYQLCQRWPPSSSARQQAGTYEPSKKTSSHHFNNILENAEGSLSLSNFNLTVPHKILLIFLHPFSLLADFSQFFIMFRLLFLSVHWARRLPVFRSLPYSTQVGINLTSLCMCILRAIVYV